MLSLLGVIAFFINDNEDADVFNAVEMLLVEFVLRSILGRSS